MPIDAIPFRDVASQDAAPLDYRLRTLVPSFNVATHPISGAASLVRPASLRNLAHDHTLVLVNGKRRHRSAILVWFGGVTDGTQGPDLSPIPSIALRQVEVLRDGASAQYGSDAIAGVMNFLLKDDRAGGSLDVGTGGYRAGDGRAWNAAGNVGLPLGDTGFANLGFEYGDAGPTDRSGAAGRRRRPRRGREHRGGRPRAAVGRPDERGRPEALRQLRPPVRQPAPGLRPRELRPQDVDAGLLLPQAQHAGQHLQPRRRPTLLVGDVLDARDGVRDGSAGCPTVTITDHRPDPAALARVMADPNCYTHQEITPGRFTPSFSGVITDVSASTPASTGRPRST